MASLGKGHPARPHSLPLSVTCTRTCRAQTLLSLCSRSHSTGWWGDRQDARRAVPSVPPTASPGPLARMLVLLLKLCVCLLSVRDHTL